MGNLLLDYAFKVSAITPAAAASTGFLKKVCIVCLPKSGQTPGIYTCTNQTQIAARTDNLEAQQAINAGMSSVFILINDDLEIATLLEGHETDFYTLLISSDFDDTDIGALDAGEFVGVVGTFSSTEATVAEYAAVENQCGFYSNSTNKAKNMIYAFGKMLSNALNWKNQQYVTMPLSDDVSALGDAEAFFDDKVSFVISDSEYGNRLALFACGGKAIVAPYIRRNLELDLQSKALQYISGNQPAYTVTNATLLENQLKDVVDSYVSRGWIEAGTVEVTLDQDNFVASGAINIAEPKALWRVFAEIQQTL